MSFIFVTCVSRFSASLLASLFVGNPSLLGLVAAGLLLGVGRSDRDPLLPPGLDQAEGRADHAEHQRQQHHRRRRHPGPVPPDELPQPVGRRRRTGGDGLVVEEPLEVVRQADGRGIPPVPLLGQRLHHDPVQIATD